MLEEINNRLRILCDELAELNYVCDICIYDSDWQKGKEEALVIQDAFDWDVAVSNIKKTDLKAILKEVSFGLEYTSEGGHYANKKFYGSKEHIESTNKIIGSVKSLLRDSSKIFSFKFESGHPFYPVFWEFAFLIKLKDRGLVIVGSSSD